MALLAANGMEIAYETFGNPGDPPMLLVMGLGEQLISWDEEVCERFSDSGHFVIRYDNRDIGLSTKLERVPPPDILAIFDGDRSSAPYLIADMAEDAAALLAGLGLDSAHVVGVSMGGMIAQQLAIDHPAAVLSMCSIMSTTGDPSVGGPGDAALEVLLAPTPTERAAYLEHEVEVWRVIGSPAFFDEARVRSRAEASYERGLCPEGAERQLAAIIASPDRTAALGSIRVPTLVVHGALDPLCDLSGGLATAAAVPGSELLVIDDMAHDLEPPLWDTVIDAVVKNIGR